MNAFFNDENAIHECKQLKNICVILIEKVLAMIVFYCLEKNFEISTKCL